MENAKKIEFLKELKNLMEKFNVEIEMNVDEDEEVFNAWFDIRFDNFKEKISIDGTSFNKDDVEYILNKEVKNENSR